MKMSREDFMALYEKSLRGECTPEELELLRAYSDDFEWQDAGWADATQQEAVFARLSHSMASETKVKRLFPWKKAAAAAVALAVATGSFMWLKRPSAPVQEAKNTLPAGNIIPQAIRPGSNKAVLILGDGSEIALNDADSGRIARQGNAFISKTGHGQIVYADAGNTNEETLIYNTIHIPRGGQYSLTLPDGSKVWLNAATRLHFPVRFQGSERLVELDGEAYFEVARNERQPFRVKVRSMEVEVLGTHFNVMAYTDEATIQTTLLEGKVRLKSGESSVILRPGQQGLYAPGTHFSVRQADPEQATAWKNGYFIFNDETLPSIMRKISRWYDADIQYASRNNNLSYAGTISRFKNVEDVLRMLTLTGTVQFRVEGKIITVVN